MRAKNLYLPKNKNQRGYLSIKYSLFNTYIATLALHSYPSAHTNSRLSSLHGLTTKRGKRGLNTQKWVWLVGPTWSLWSSWFDALTMCFFQGGGCFSYGDPSTELVCKSLSWLTLGQSYNYVNLTSYPTPQTNLGARLRPSLVEKSFIIIAGSPRSFNGYGFPTFSLSGSNVRHRVGWAVLPSPSNNKSLSKFILMAALAAYSASREADGQKWD